MDLWRRLQHPKKLGLHWEDVFPTWDWRIIKQRIRVKFHIGSLLGETRLYKRF